MKLSKYYPFLFGLFGFPIQVFVGNAFSFLYFKILFSEEVWRFELLGTICKIGEYKQSILPYFITISFVILLLFLLAYFIGNKVFSLVCASYFLFISFAFFILPLPNNDTLFYIRALFISSSFIQIMSHFIISNDFILYLFPMLFSILILRKLSLNRSEIAYFLFGSFMSLIGSFSFFYGISLLMNR
jgi:hypothetical protein